MQRRGELWGSRLLQETVGVVGEGGSPRLLNRRGNARPCILLWDAGILREMPVPPPISPSRVLLVAIFGVHVPSSLGAPQPDLSLAWAYLGAPSACHAQGRGQSCCADVQEDKGPPALP